MTPRLSVSDFLAVANQSLEAAFGGIEVEGEVAEFKVSQQKFVFFSLKDTAGSVSCFMTVWQLRVPLEDGMRVVVRALPKVTAWGKFSLTVSQVQLVGEGSIQRGLQLLRQQLTKEGLFRPERKRPLPPYPRRVAVVSSIEAAGYADFMKIAAERWGGVRFQVAAVQVQGRAAADQMRAAIEYVQQLPELPEVIVLLRGGGSAADLQAFNDERLVRAVAASRLPVLTGIGHETDETLCDLAADVRAATPSNAAQLLLPDKAAVRRQLKTEVLSAARALGRAIDERQTSVRRALGGALDEWRQRLEERRRLLAAQQRLIREYDPEAALRRGYALVAGRREIGSIVKITTQEAIMKARVIEYEQRTTTRRTIGAARGETGMVS